jgi:hypothetical protein
MNDAYFQYFYKIMESKVFPANMSKEFQERNIVPTYSCVMIQKSLFNNVLWDARCNNYLDYYLWVQIAKKTDFYYINEKLTNWRMHKNSYINRDLSDFDKEYFYNVQICGIINNKSALEKKILTLLIYLKQIQKQIIRFKLSPKESYLIVFGKTLFKREKSE